MNYSSQRRSKPASLKWHIILLMLIFGFVVLKVSQINSQAEDTFAIQKLEHQKSLIQEDINDIKWEVSSVRSLAAITARASELKLMAPKEVSFLKIGLSAVAVVDGMPEAPLTP